MGRKHSGNFNFLSHYTYYVPGFAELAILSAFFLAGALIGNGVSALLTLFMGQDVGMECATLVSYPIMFIPPMIYASARSRRLSSGRDGIPVDDGHFAPKGVPVCAVVAAIGTLSANFFSDGLSSLLPQMPEWLEETLKGLTNGTLWINILCVSIFAPVFEEWLCRGMVLRGLLGNNVKPVWSIIISAAFFAIIHLNPWQAIPAFILGCVFGYVYYKTGSLKLTMLMHCVNNSFALLMTRIPKFEDMDTWRDVFQGPEYFIVLASSLVLFALCVLTFSKIEPVKPE